ncbi:MAG: FtsX-like permease family protein [Pseudomonadota bacterium]
MIIRPLMDGSGFYTSVKIRPENLQKTLRFIENRWKKFSGGQPFTFSFLSEDFDSLYKREKKSGFLFSIFTFLAVFIACLGLLGLVSFAAEERTKEIGIRKVLGSPMAKIILLLTKEIVFLQIIAVFISTPLVLWAMSRWLQSFAYRIHLGVFLVLAVLLVSFLIPILTVVFRTYRAAAADPVHSLRAE